MFIIGVQDGMLEVRCKEDVPALFKVDDREGLKAFFQRRGITNIMSSSSMNWPHDYGVPESVEVGVLQDTVKYALSWQGEVPIDFRDLPGFTTHEKAVNLLKTLESGLNILGDTGFPDALKEFVPRMHRTLQQGLMRDFVVPILEVFAEQYENEDFDARNEATCKSAHSMKEVRDCYGYPTI